MAINIILTYVHVGILKYSLPIVILPFKKVPVAITTALHFTVFCEPTRVSKIDTSQILINVQQHVYWK